MAKWFKTAVIVLFTAVVLVFTLQNIQSVTVAFLTASITLPVSLLVIGVYVLGMFTGGLPAVADSARCGGPSPAAGLNAASRQSRLTA